MPGINAARMEHESPVRVVISPSQSSFFAGEQLSVTITFTNTRTPEAGPSKPSEQAYPQARTHKRGAHSISSAPLARPPTSPGTPRTPNLSPRKLVGFKDETLPSRKGLVGTTRKPYQDGQLPELLEQRRKKLLAKSLSISISSQELEEQLGEGIIATTPASAPYHAQEFADAKHSPTSPHIPSPLSRTDTLALSSNHPHARKQSILDGQFSFESLSSSASATSSYTSTSSLSLTTISEASSSPYPSTPSPTTPRVSSPLSPSYSQVAFHPGTSPNSNVVQAYPSVTISRPHHNHHFSQQTQLGLGQPSNPVRGNGRIPPRTAFSSTFSRSGAELVLYSYAQLVGTVQVTPESTGSVPTQVQAYRMNKIRRVLTRKHIVGGGSMDISRSFHGGPSIGLGFQPAQSYGHARRKQGHGRSASFSASLMSLLATPGAANDRSPSLNNNATSPLGHRPTDGPGPGGGTALEEDIDPELPLPTFEAQPSMLAVDLFLLPGDSRSYTYTIKLPDVLPPTYRGRSLQFSYELLVGTCRADSSPSDLKSNSGGAGASGISRVMKVPIRVYNHVAMNRPPAPYNILWPVSRDRLSGLRKNDLPETQGKVVEETEGVVSQLKKISVASSPKYSEEASLQELKQYTRRLIASLPAPINGNGVEESGASEVSGDNVEVASSALSNGDAATEAGLRLSMDEAKEQEEEEDKAIVGCREAVEILTRLPKKASYDVNKDGVKVAVLTFTKSAYRLGETVTGVVELNERVGRARVLKLCAILESHETLPTSVAPPVSSRNLKRSYGEHYASFTLNTLRTTFSLDIPSDASPTFQVQIGDPAGYPELPPAPPPTSLGGLEWKVRLCLLVAIASDLSDQGTEGVYFKSLERDGPRGDWGTSWCAPNALAPLEKPRVGLAHLKKDNEKAKTKSWTQLFVDSVWNTIGSVTPGERGEHDNGDESDAEGKVGEGIYDGIKPDFAGGVGKGVDFSGGEEGWKYVRLETVECEVPIKVWPGNTAFRAVDVVFDV